MPAPVPFLDLRAANAPLEGAFFRELRALYRRSGFIGGLAVERFERAFADALGARHCVSVSSGTAALHLSLVAAGVGPGDEVIVPAFTFPGAAGPVLRLGARPVFADVRLEDGCLDPRAAERAVTKRTRAVLATHLFGHPADLDALGSLGTLARGRIALIEDAAQAHGGSWHGRALGSIGDFGCFSFYPTKNLGGIGDAGAILVRDARVAARLRRLRDHGQRARFHPEEPGFNARMDALHAAFLSLKLPGLARGNAKRAAIAARYLRALGARSDSAGRSGLWALRPAEAGASAWHAFVVRARNRRAFLRHLDAEGIGHQVYYPKALPDLPLFRARRAAGSRDEFPAARELARTAVALPLHPHLGAADEARVRAALTAFR
jgi:dTDP-3-amino-3,4,6-trideoxy-alpha-D-glucose transaminase